MGWTSPCRVDVRPGRFRSLASKFSFFTAVLVFWVVATLLYYNAREHGFAVTEGIVLCSLVVLVAALISRFTIRLIARPLSLLRDGITSVKNGRLEPIQISPTGDEIEDLGEAFNEMIRALAESRAEVRRYQEQLEDRIRQRTEDLEAATHRALAASHAKSEFLANVSHELRTPMNGVIGMLDIVLDGRIPAEQRDHLETAQRCAYALLAIVNDLLDLSKIEAGKMVLEKVPFHIRQLVEDCAKAHMPSAANKGIAILVSSGAGLPEKVVGDPLRIRQIVTNLLSNAVKFTDSGSVRVHIDGAAISAGKLELKLTVRDTGTGIPADKLPFIFEKFTQADGSISRKYGGTGLGLTITRRLIEMHEGSIDVESVVGQGSTFTVKLACEPAAPSTSKPAGDPALPQPAQAARNGPVRVLVVEDNAVNQKVVTAILRKRGYEPVIANHGREALDLLRCAPDPRYYKVVLMDVQMPVLDGLEATRLIRAEPRWDYLPIVAMTAHAMNGDRDQCLEAGMNGYISKPVNPGHLIATVERFMAREPRLPPGTPAPPQASPLELPAAASLLGADRDLVERMIDVFLQLAPERMQRLSAAARQRDAAKLIEESEKISNVAEQIAATAVSDCTREIKDAASAEDYEHVQHSLLRLAEEISLLQQNVSVP